MQTLNAKSNISTKDNPITYAYLRVSTEEQKDDGFSIDFQKNAAEEYAKTNTLGGITYFTEASSASKVSEAEFDIASDLYKSLKNRPELQKLVKLAQQKKFTDLIVYSRDRLARNLEMHVGISFYFSKNNVKIHYSKPGEMLKSDDNRLTNFFNIILGSVAELEANLIASRVKSGLEECIKSGAWAGGRAPYGYDLKKYGRKNNTLRSLRLEREKVEEIFKLYVHEGLSYRDIADRLNSDDKYPTKYWTKSKIERIICNEVYSGYLVYNRRNKERKEGLPYEIVKSSYREDLDVAKDKWNTSVNIRKVKSTNKNPKYYNTPFLLRGKLFCPYCDQFLKTKNYGVDSKGYHRGYIYRCNVINKDKPHFIIKKDEVELLFMQGLSTINTQASIDLFWEIYMNRLSELQTNNNNLLQSICETLPQHELKCSKIDTIIKDSIDIEINTLTAELNDLKSQLKTKGADKSTLNKEIKEIQDKLNLELSIKDSLLSEKTNLLKEITMMKEHKKRLETPQSNIFNSKVELSEALTQFVKYDFEDLDNIRKRMIIDILVDKIYITRDDESTVGYRLELIVKKT